MQIYTCGIGTDVGKTHFSALFCHLFEYHYFKLIQAGIPKDSDFVRELIPKERILGEGFLLQTPASPHIGKQLENASYQAFDLAIPQTKNLIVELAGGLFSPIDEKHTMIDFMAHFKKPAILVAKNYLGAINHTLLSIQALQSRNISLLALVCMGEEEKDFNDFVYDYAGIMPLNLDFYNAQETRDDQIFIQKMSKILES